MNLTDTLDFSGVPGRQQEPIPYFDPKKYEQLLATAVLNKVSDLSQICSLYVVVALIHVLRIDFLTWFIWQSFEKSKNVNNDLLGLPSLTQHSHTLKTSYDFVMAFGFIQLLSVGLLGGLFAIV